MPSPDDRRGFLMRWGFFALFLPAAGPAFAQYHYYNVRGNPYETTIFSDPAAAPCINPTQPPYSADPTGTADSTRALQAAINSAQSQNSLTTPGYVCIPGGKYKLSSKITINSGGVTVCGAGVSVTVLLPRQGDDVFYVAKNPVSQYISGVNFCNFRIYRADNPTAGTGIHLVGVQIGSVDNVEVDGPFYGYWCETCLNFHFNFALALGQNTNPGSRMYRFSKGTYGGATNNAAIYMASIQARAGVAPNVDTAIEINDADGITCVGCHFGFSAGPAMILQPGDVDQQLTNLDCAACEFDTAGTYGVYIAEPTSYTKNKFGILTFTGSTFFISGLDGFYVDSSATHLKNVTATGARFFINGRHGLNLNAGTHFEFAHSVFSGNNNKNLSGDHVALGGTVASVNLDGSQFATGTGAHAVRYNIVTSGSADRLYGSHLDFQNAATGNMSLGASGTHVDLVAAP
jgi:hypothetical protein